MIISKVFKTCSFLSSVKLTFRAGNRLFSNNTVKSDNKMVKFLTQSEATNIDKDLFEKYNYSVDQLMEVAGLSCAIAISKCYPIEEHLPKTILVICGPGNNGGDGLVCSRYLKRFGYKPKIYYPKRPNNQLYKNLTQQCIDDDIPFLDDLSVSEFVCFNRLIVDALFGFSFKPPVRAEFLNIMQSLYESLTPICSIDVPSGWNVETGPPSSTLDFVAPEMLISLTAPKLCSTYFEGKFHYLGGRFVPDKLALEYKLDLPEYPGTDLVVNLK